MEERRGEEEGAAQGEDKVGPAGGVRGRTGREGRGHRYREGRAGRGSAVAAAGEWERGAAAGEGERRVREAQYGRENEETLGATMEVSHRRRRPSPEPKGNPSIAGDSGIQSTNRTRPDEALDETNAAVPSDSADDPRIGSNCLPELSSELESLRTSASNTGS